MFVTFVDPYKVPQISLTFLTFHEPYRMTSFDRTFLAIYKVKRDGFTMTISPISTSTSPWQFCAKAILDFDIHFIVNYVHTVQQHWLISSIYTVPLSVKFT